VDEFFDHDPIRRARNALRPGIVKTTSAAHLGSAVSLRKDQRIIGAINTL